MLIIKVFINENPIDIVLIHNKGAVHEEMSLDLCEYRIEKPEIYKNISIYHYRSDGWSVLLENALKIINSKGGK